MHTLQESGLLIKLFYQNQQNSVSYVKEFHRIKEMRRDPMSCILCKMIQKFHCIYCKMGTQKFVKLLRFISFRGWWLMSIDHGALCGIVKLIFALMDNCRIWEGKNSYALSSSNPCIRKKVIVWCGLSFDPNFLRDKYDWDPNVFRHRTMIP